MTETQNNTADRPLRFGTRGWQRPDWSDTYYPEDLPEDWRLGYYANELSAVLLPASDWVGVEPQQLSDWVDETHEAFLFYLMVDPGQDSGAQLQLAAALGPRLGGVLWPTAPAPEGFLAPVPGLPDAQHGWADAQGLRLATLAVDGLNLRQRRALLEALAPYLTSGCPAAVILEGATLTPAEARELQTVAELMGLA